MEKYWFKPKSCGWGIGLPITWQGWLAILVLLFLTGVCAFMDGILTPRRTMLPLDAVVTFSIQILVLSILFCYVFQSKVEGGLKWRWGKDKE
ncbi:MAG: hypothetical protein HQL16_01440 [Candidatus Omnitrophica bacterium]|nr:hypothetical protein [Candidatus Omnitrophota bacterium]